MNENDEREYLDKLNDALLPFDLVAVWFRTTWNYPGDIPKFPLNDAVAIVRMKDIAEALNEAA